MQPLYNLNKALMLKLEPKIYSTKKKEIEGIFDVPVDNAIATNKIGNAITLLHFNGKKIKYKTVKKNFIDYVSGGQNKFLPVFSDDTIGYSIGRGFLLFNIKSENFNYQSIAGDFDFAISSIQIIDAQKNIFLFKIRDRKKKQPNFLRLIDLSNNSKKIIREKEIGSYYVTKKDKTILLYCNATIKALNIKFKEIDHPIINIFNNEKKLDFGEINDLIIHPSLPFAVLSEDKYNGSHLVSTTIWTISWREKDINSDKPLMVRLFANDTGSLFKFTRDGKWMVFRDHNNEPEQFILMPVDSELPYFLGKPIYLGEVPDYPSSGGVRAMTQNPAGFVVSKCDGVDRGCKLLKWDFTEAEKFIEKNK